MAKLIKTLTSSDQKHRVHFTQREDGMVQYSEEYLWHDEDQGQKYTLWKPNYPPSGLFSDEITAEADARRQLSWLAKED
jgi:hypothetical protein